jgi:hypothetical protein
MTHRPRFLSDCSNVENRVKGNGKIIAEKELFIPSPYIAFSLMCVAWVTPEAIPDYDLSHLKKYLPTEVLC